MNFSFRPATLKLISISQFPCNLIIVTVVLLTLPLCFFLKNVEGAKDKGVYVALNVISFKSTVAMTLLLQYPSDKVTFKTAVIRVK